MNDRSPHLLRLTFLSFHPSITMNDRSPHLLRLTFLSFHLQPRDAPAHRFSCHSSVTGDFQASPFSCRLAANIPPNRVRHPADRQFASGCSPPRLTTTQLPSATELWHTPTRTSTVLIWRHHGRTTEPLRGIVQDRFTVFSHKFQS